MLATTLLKSDSHCEIFIELIKLLFSVLSFAQSAVRGAVLDNNGLPLPGANIIIRGTSSLEPFQILMAKA